MQPPQERAPGPSKDAMADALDDVMDTLGPEAAKHAFHRPENTPAGAPFTAEAPAPGPDAGFAARPNPIGQTPPSQPEAERTDGPEPLKPIEVAAYLRALEWQNELAKRATAEQLAKAKADAEARAEAARQQDRTDALKSLRWILAQHREHIRPGTSMSEINQMLATGVERYKVKEKVSTSVYDSIQEVLGLLKEREHDPMRVRSVIQDYRIRSAVPPTPPPRPQRQSPPRPQRQSPPRPRRQAPPQPGRQAGQPQPAPTSRPRQPQPQRPAAPQPTQAPGSEAWRQIPVVPSVLRLVATAKRLREDLFGQKGAK